MPLLLLSFKRLLLTKPLFRRQVVHRKHHQRHPTNWRGVHLRGKECFFELFAIDFHRHRIDGRTELRCFLRGPLPHRQEDRCLLRQDHRRLGGRLYFLLYTKATTTITTTTARIHRIPQEIRRKVTTTIVRPLRSVSEVLIDSSYQRPTPALSGLQPLLGFGRAVVGSVRTQEQTHLLHTRYLRASFHLY